MADKIYNGETSDWIRAPPPPGSVCERMAKAIYNPEDGSFFGRTAKRWGIVLVFYAVFYSVLALLFALCMGGLFYTLDMKKPTHVLDKSLIGSSPGVTSRPNSILYNNSDPDTYETYVRQLTSLLAPYMMGPLKSQKDCTFHDNYGFPETPCIFVKINKIYDWKPDYYDGNSSQIPVDAPEDLKEFIQNQKEDERNQVWISCWDEHDNSTGFEYPWGRGISASQFPYQNQEGYLNPLLAVRLSPPVGTLVMVRCRAWAKNIIYNKSIKEPSGYVRLPVYIVGDENIISK